ncbi:hypothetical protein PHISCL_10207, partial [Aspergillus sclerotialis]
HKDIVPAKITKNTVSNRGRVAYLRANDHDGAYTGFQVVDDSGAAAAVGNIALFLEVQRENFGAIATAAH